MEFPPLLNITPIYISILGLLFILFTVRTALYRINNKILIGAGDDPEMLRLIRGHANFIETVPMALFLLVIMEILGASGEWLHSLGVALVLARVAHYLGLTGAAPLTFRTVGMFITLLTVLISSFWVLIKML